MQNSDKKRELDFYRQLYKFKYGNLHSLLFLNFSIKSGGLFCVCMVYYRYSI